MTSPAPILDTSDEAPDLTMTVAGYMPERERDPAVRHQMDRPQHATHYRTANVAITAACPCGYPDATWHGCATDSNGTAYWRIDCPQCTERGTG